MKIRYAGSVLISLAFVNIWKLMGKKIHTSGFLLISPRAHLATEKKGEIFLGRKNGIRPNVEIHADGGIIRIGNNCFINRNCLIVAHESIVLEEGVTIGPNVCIYDHDHDGKKGFSSLPVRVGKNTWIGAGCIILKGVSIGANCVIGAGSLITKDVPSNSTVIQKRENTIIKRVQ